MFKVGQKVVCVDDKAISGTRWNQDEKPIVGSIYTITRVHMVKGNPSVWLSEIKRCDAEIRQHGPDIGYGAYRFRPVVEGHKGMEVLKSILINPKKKITSDQFDKDSPKVGRKETV